MTITVQLFARAKDLAGAPEIAVELPPGARVRDLRSALAGICPALAGLLARSAFAVNSEWADDDTPINKGAEVALLPPVSGG
jgi:molybdopterin converting factor subunit 1